METWRIKEILSQQLELLAKDSAGCSGDELATVSNSMLCIAEWLVNHPNRVQKEQNLSVGTTQPQREREFKEISKAINALTDKIIDYHCRSLTSIE